MFTGQDVLQLMLLPLVFAIAAMAFAWRRKSSGGAPRGEEVKMGNGSGGWAMTLAIGGAVLAAGSAQFRPKGLPREAMDWLVLLPLVGLAAGWVADGVPAWAATGLILVVGAVETWLIAMHLAAGTASLAAILLLGATPGVVYGVMQLLVKKRSGPGIVTMLLLIAGATVIVESAGTYIQFGQYTVALAAAMTGVLFGRVVFGGPEVSRGSLGAFLLIWTAMLTFGYLWADVPAWRTGLLAVAPLGAWVAEIPRGLRPLPRALLRLAAVGVPLAVAGIPAAIELAKLLRSQTGVDG